MYYLSLRHLLICVSWSFSTHGPRQTNTLMGLVCIRHRSHHFATQPTQWGLCEYVIVHTILGGSPVILWISLGGKPKWLPLKFGYHDVMRTGPIYLKGVLQLLYGIPLIKKLRRPYMYSSTTRTMMVMSVVAQFI